MKNTGKDRNEIARLLKELVPGLSITPECIVKTKEGWYASGTIKGKMHHFNSPDNIKDCMNGIKIAWAKDDEIEIEKK